MPKILHIDFFDVPPGSSKPYHGASLPAGFVWASGKTVGNASSNATERANKDCYNLFSVMWSSYTNTTMPIYTSAGVLSTRGASALADWTANKAITIPDGRGRTMVGMDNLGGAAAGRLTSTTVDGTILGNAGGEQTHQLIVSEMPAHYHNYAIDNITGAGANAYSGNAGIGGSSQTDTQGGGLAHNNVQPILVANHIIKL